MEKQGNGWFSAVSARDTLQGLFKHGHKAGLSAERLMRDNVLLVANAGMG